MHRFTMWNDTTVKRQKKALEIYIIEKTIRIKKSYHWKLSSKDLLKKRPTVFINVEKQILINQGCRFCWIPPLQKFKTLNIEISELKFGILQLTVFQSFCEIIFNSVFLMKNRYYFLILIDLSCRSHGLWERDRYQKFCSSGFFYQA